MAINVLPVPPIGFCAFPHPLRGDKIAQEFPAGLTVLQMLNATMPDRADDAYYVIELNGIVISRQYWRNLKPKPGTHIAVRAIAKRGGKSPFRLIATLVILAAASWAAPYVAGGLGIASSSAFGITGVAFTKAVLGFVGTMLLNAIVPPPTPKMTNSQNATSSQSFFIQAARNTVPTRGTKIPRPYGTHRFYPYYAALPYTEIIGDEQYLRAVFLWGYGPLNIRQLKIGETPIEQFENVDIEHRYGYPGDPLLTLFTNSPHQEDLTVSLTSEAGWQTRTTEDDTDAISLDFSFQSGCAKYNGAGNPTPTTVQLEFQYAPTGTQNWSVGSGGTSLSTRTVALQKPQGSKQGDASGTTYMVNLIVIDRFSGDLSVITGNTARTVERAETPLTPTTAFALASVVVSSATLKVVTADITDLRTADAPLRGSASDFLVVQSGPSMNLQVGSGMLFSPGLTITEAKKEPFIKSTYIPVPKGKYDVRVRRTTPDSTKTSIVDAVTWSALRSFESKYPISFNKPIALTAVRIKATGQLQGAIDRLNGVVEAILPIWNGADWSTLAPTSNPAAIIKDILQGTARKKPLADSRVGLKELQDFYEFCEENSFEYNAVVDYATSTRDLMGDVAAVGRGAAALKDGSKRTVIIDRPQTVASNVFTPSNSWDYQGSIVFKTLPHMLAVVFVNRDKGWIQDQVEVYRDGFTKANATTFDKIEAPGVTSSDQAWRFGRYYLAVAKLRPEIHSFMASIENLRTTRGDLIRFRHDVPKIGVGEGRVKSLTFDVNGDIATMKLDTKLTLQSDKTYQARIRLSDFTQVVWAINAFDGETDTFTFTISLPLEKAPRAIMTDSKMQGDLVVIGETEQETIPLLVKNVIPQQKLQAQLVCVAYNEAIYTADTGTIPDFTSNITDQLATAVPSIKSTRSDGPVLLRSPDGSLNSRIVVSFSRPTGDLRAGITGVQARYRETGSSASWNVTTTYDVDTGNISLTEVQDAISYDFQLRFVERGGVYGLWSELQSHVVIGKSAPPGDVTSLSAQQNGEAVTIHYILPEDLDLAGVELRYVPGA